MDPVDRTIPTEAEVNRLEVEWRRFERARKPGRLFAYQRWQAAVALLREAQRLEEDPDRDGM